MIYQITKKKMEKLLNKYLKIEPLTHDSFIASQRDSFEEIGVVLSKDESIVDIPIGAKVYFDSFMAKKYPIVGTDKFQWFVHYDEIVKYEYDETI